MLTFVKKFVLNFQRIIICTLLHRHGNNIVIEGGVDIIKVLDQERMHDAIQNRVGMPQLSCIMDCGDVAHGVGKYIIGDGGITCG